MSRALRILLVALAALALFEWWAGQPPSVPVPEAAGTRVGRPSRSATEYPAFLPPEAIDTLQLIERGGPFPYSRDGVVFQNRERRLPSRPAAYYREYTVRTPGENDRGARRIVVGGQPAEAFYYTDDHYRSFRKVEIEQ